MLLASYTWGEDAADPTIDLAARLGPLWGDPEEPRRVFHRDAVELLTAPVVEEFVFRGAVYRAFAAHISPGWANVVQAAIAFEFIS